MRERDQRERDQRERESLRRDWSDHEIEFTVILLCMNDMTVKITSTGI